MFGLDTWIAHFSDGATLALVVVVAVVLGFRHATDPDHLAAVTTLIATGRDRASRTAARLGLAWGFGHATSLFAFGLPIVVFKAYLPEPVQAAAETSVGVMIALLALWMAALSTGWGMMLATSPGRGSLSRFAPILGCASLAFGVWYALAALSLAPYYF